MLRAINLNNQLLCKTGEVRNVGADHNLPSEMTASYVNSSKVPPQDRFRFRGIGSQLFRNLSLEVADRPFDHVVTHPARYASDPPPHGEGGSMTVANHSAPPASV